MDHFRNTFGDDPRPLWCAAPFPNCVMDEAIMSSYATLTIGDFPVATTKDEVDPTIMMLFDVGDKQLFTFASDDYDPFLSAKYVASLKVIRDRLEHMGFTRKAIECHFERGLADHVKQLNSKLQERIWVEYIVDILQREIDLVSKLNFQEWIYAFRYIIENKLEPDRVYGPYENSDVKRDHPPLACYLLGAAGGDCIWFPSNDFRVLMRAATEVTGTAVDVTYDLTDLVCGDCALPEDDYCLWARQQMLDDIQIEQKTIVLTEGNSDSWAIRRSLKLFYPHLAAYFSFMDFDGARAAGGAGVLVSTIKAFSGSGIINRTIAFFDNDTAACSALRALQKIELPKNIRVLQYNDLDAARNYPTQGPQGVISMDVNGLAGSLELYFGDDVLREPDGSLVMVQWRGYDEAVSQYQGELRNKTRLQERFAEKLAICEKDRTQIEKYDWTGMLLILEQLRTAFH